MPKIVNFSFAGGAPIEFRDAAPYNAKRRRIEVNSITLIRYTIDASVWGALRGVHIANLNMSDCLIVSWAGIARVSIDTLMIERCSGFSDFATNVCPHALDRLVLSSCDMEMAAAVFPLLGQLTASHIVLHDVDALFLDHVSMDVPLEQVAPTASVVSMKQVKGKEKRKAEQPKCKWKHVSVQNELETFRLSRTANHASVKRAVALVCKVARLPLAEFAWSESGLGDRLTDVFATDEVRALPWAARRLVLSNNGLTADVYERLEAFKAATPELYAVDLSENAIAASLVEQIGRAPDVEETSSESSVPDEDEDEESDDKEEESDAMVLDTEEVVSFAVDDPPENGARRGKKRRKDDDEDAAESRAIASRGARGNTLEALVARYFGKPARPPIKVKKV